MYQLQYSTNKSYTISIHSNHFTLLCRCLKKATLKEVVSLEVCDAVNWMKSMFLSWKVNGTKFVPELLHCLLYYSTQVV